uniref:Uncharacterized protein n=1 Tax=Drosophila pseudoobscura pseudoobscura TaxID=46245 RepID=A0A0R3P247_DROPS
MRRHSLKDSLGGNQHLNEEQSQLFHLGQSLSSSHVDPCNIEHRAFKLSTGGDQHPIENTRAEGITFFDPKLSTLSPPSPPAGLSSMGHQFDKTTKDAPQIYDSRLPAMRACFIEKPVRGPQNDMQQKLCEIPKIFGTTNVGDQQLFDTKGPSGIEKLSFNQSIGGPQHIKQKIIGAIQQDGKNTKGGSQKFQGPGPSGLGVHLQDSKGRATGESMGVPQNIMQKTIGPRQSGLGQRSLNQSINRPQHLMKKKTMDACLQGDKKTKGGPQNLECRGPSGLEVNIWDSMGHAKGKFMGGSQNLMLKTMVERLKFHEMRKHKPQKVYDPMTPTKGRRHFGCSVCSATSSKCTPEVPTVVEPPFYDVKYPTTARSTKSDGSQ